MSKRGADDAYIHVRRTAHLNRGWGRAVIYEGCLADRSGGPVERELLFDRPMSRQGMLDDLERRVNHLGWRLGVDRWRAPLNPASGILATAHLCRGVSGYGNAWRCRQLMTSHWPVVENPASL